MRHIFDSPFNTSNPNLILYLKVNIRYNNVICNHVSSILKKHNVCVGYGWGNVCYVVNFPPGEYLLYSKVPGGRFTI